MASWQVWALLSAVFAALTAVFAKVGVAGIHPDVATLIRTVVILIVLGALVAALGEALLVPTRLSADVDLSRSLGTRDRRFVVVLFSRAAARRCRTRGTP